MDEGSIETTALEEFRAARLQAGVEVILAALRGKSADLLSYDEVRQRIGATETGMRELKDIPLNAIVGSVGRYTDFTRRFFPRQEEDQKRWATVRMHVGGMEGLPPIEAYQVGDAYFVIDGNHRVSVARSLGAEAIEGYVTLVETPVPLSSDADPTELFIKERYARFLEKTGLHGSVPEADFTMSAAGNYRVLEDQIHRHRAQMGADIPLEIGAEDWCRSIYLPVIQLIRRRGLMRDFPDRTETDLYVWIDQYQEALLEKLGWTIGPETVVEEIVQERSPRADRVLRRVGGRLIDAVTPDALEAGPAPGAWRKAWARAYRHGRMFSHILVAISGREEGWLALDQALQFAQHEDGRLLGLHVSKQAKRPDAVDKIQVEFDRRCAEAGVSGEFAASTGPTARTISDRARWSDLVVVSLAHPPGPQPVDRLGSGFSKLIRRCPRPILAVPRAPSKIERLLLAFDNSPKSWEAAFVAAYLSKHWNIPLVVASVEDAAGPPIPLDELTGTLQSRDVTATFLTGAGRPADFILEAARTHDCGLILMGGYSKPPLMEVVVGSAVDEVLRTRNRPVLICR